MQKLFPFLTHVEQWFTVARYHYRKPPECAKIKQSNAQKLRQNCRLSELLKSWREFGNILYMTFYSFGKAYEHIPPHKVHFIWQHALRTQHQCNIGQRMNLIYNWGSEFCWEVCWCYDDDEGVWRFYDVRCWMSTLPSSGNWAIFLRTAGQGSYTEPEAFRNTQRLSFSPIRPAAKLQLISSFWWSWKHSDNNHKNIQTQQLFGFMIHFMFSTSVSCNVVMCFIKENIWSLLYNQICY